MSAVFIKLLNMSIAAGWLILAVLLLRLLFRRAPKWISCFLWVLVAARLIVPVSIESSFSLIPSAETVPADIATADTPAIRSGISVLNSLVNPVLSGLTDTQGSGKTHLLESDDADTSGIHAADFPESFGSQAGHEEPSGLMPGASVLRILNTVLPVVWIIGMGGLLFYALVSYLRLRKTVSASMEIQRGVMACDEVHSPFILGILRPVIYVPSRMNDDDLRYVLAHEKAHLSRHDHWWKPLGYLLLSIYWFHPLCWVAYILLCRDIEMACDEKVIRDMDRAYVAGYSRTLLNCSSPGKIITACPLAFGEVSTRKRVKSVLNYHKPAFWIIIAAVIACVVLSVCFLTNPRKKTMDLAGNYECEGFGGPFSVTLNKDGSATYYEGAFSSYIGIGSWEYRKGIVTMTDRASSEEKQYHFKVVNNDLVFRKKDSAEFLYIKVEDGTVFKRLQNDDQAKTGIVTMTGTIVEAGGGDDVIFMPAEGSRELNSSDRIAVSLEGKEFDFTPGIGDYITVEYDGVLEETYPARPAQVYNVDVTMNHIDHADTNMDVCRFDLDQDGVKEEGFLSLGQLSGPFSIVLTFKGEARDEKYKDVFIFFSISGEVRFSQQDEKLLVTVTKWNEEEVRATYEVSLKDGHIVLTNCETGEIAKTLEFK